MRKNNVFHRVVSVVCEEIGFPKDEIVLETNLKRDLVADNEDLTFIAMGVEDEFEIDFSDETIRKCSTVCDIVEYIKKQKKKKEKIKWPIPPIRLKKE